MIKPDFVFRAQRVAVFVDGCFFHGCPKHLTWPKQNAASWADLARLSPTASGNGKSPGNRLRSRAHPAGAAVYGSSSVISTDDQLP